MNTKEIAEIAIRAGEILLCSGAEIYRVEDTILRIFRSYNVECECFVLLTGIFISAEGTDGETVTVIKRLKGHTINLHRIDLVNTFSRNLEIHPLPYSEAMGILKTIQNAPSYSFYSKLGCAGLTAFVYTLLFKGKLLDACAALIISMVIFTIKEKMSEIGLVQFFEFFISGLLAGTLSLIATLLFPILDVYKIIIGAIMILVPGVAITNGIKDALYGDTVSSLYRISEAAFISVAIGAGVGIVLSVGIKFI